jgi:hypothetical protein
MSGFTPEAMEIPNCVTPSKLSGERERPNVEAHGPGITYESVLMDGWLIGLDEKRTGDELHRESPVPGDIGEPDSEVQSLRSWLRLEREVFV